MRTTVEYGGCSCGKLAELYYYEHRDEYFCEQCLDDLAQNDTEAAYERMCEDFHDGGSTAWPDAERKRMEEARKLK